MAVHSHPTTTRNVGLEMRQDAAAGVAASAAKWQQMQAEQTDTKCSRLDPTILYTSTGATIVCATDNGRTDKARCISAIPRQPANIQTKQTSQQVMLQRGRILSVLFTIVQAPDGSNIYWCTFYCLY